MYAHRLKKLHHFLKQTEQHIQLHQVRLNTQYDLEDVEPPKWFERGILRKNEAQSEIIRLTDKKLRLQRQIRKLERKQAYAETEPSLTYRAKERLHEARDAVAGAVDSVMERKERIKSWWHQHIKPDYSALPELSEGEQVSRRIEANHKRYFPDDWEKKEKLRKLEEKREQSASRYWQEKIEAAERENKQRARAEAKAERRAERAACQIERERLQQVNEPVKAELTEEVDTLTEAIREQERKEPQW